MSKIFDGKKLRNEILADLTEKVSKMEKKPVMAVFLVGGDAVSNKYIELKKKLAEKICVEVRLINLPEDSIQDQLLEKIREANNDINIDGIMIQIPLPSQIDKFEIVNAIDIDKDIDGLRFCGGFKAKFQPPVVLAILEAVKESGKKIEESHVVIVGRGFLVGWPLAQYLEEAVPGLVIADSNTKGLLDITKDADILISATGKAGLIKPEMVKEGAVLIDAGTSEIGGQFMGDIDPVTFNKASFYTPVPGGIGPVTVAMLFKNLIEK